MFRKILIALALVALPSVAQAQTLPWFVIGDSIISYPTGGASNDLPINLIARERNMTIISLASPGAEMGDANGFNGTWLTSTLDHVCGTISYCAGVVVQAGVNDFVNDTTWAAQQTALVRVFNWATARGKKVLVLDLIYTSHETTGANGAGYTFEQLRIARNLECTSRPTICTFATRPASLNYANAPMYFSTEVASGVYLHLSPAGRRAYATWVEQAAAAAGLF